jgi:hypothetical protein
MIDAHLALLEQRWAEGCCTAAILWRELATLGFQGRYTVVKTWAAQQRGAEIAAAGTQGKSPAWTLPSVSRIAHLLLAGNADANTPDAAFVTSLLVKVPALADTVAATKRLTLLLRRKSEEALATVLDAAGATMLGPFITELRKDIGAVQAALDLPWTTSRCGAGPRLCRTAVGAVAGASHGAQPCPALCCPGSHPYCRCPRALAG